MAPGKKRRRRQQPKSQNTGRDTFSSGDVSKAFSDPQEPSPVFNRRERQDDSMASHDVPESSRNSEGKFLQNDSQRALNDSSALPVEDDSPSPPAAQRNPLTTPVVVQCSTCRTIIADTLEGYLGSNSETGTISFNAVRRIDVAEQCEIASKGWLRHCVFQKLSCEECAQELGWKLNTTTAEFDRLRDMFTFDKSCLLTYQLGSCGSKPRVVTSTDKAAADANFIALQSMDDRIRMVTDAVHSLAEGLESREKRNSSLHDTFLAWEGRFQRLEQSGKRLGEVLDKLLDNGMPEPVIGMNSSALRIGSPLETTGRHSGQSDGVNGVEGQRIVFGQTSKDI